MTNNKRPNLLEKLGIRKETGFGHIRTDNRINPTMQQDLSETSYIEPGTRMWETSYMALEDLRGMALYEALMAIKPADLAEGDWAAKAGVNRGFFSDLKYKDIRPRMDTIQKLRRVAEASNALVSSGAAQPPQSATDATVQLRQVDLSYSMGPGANIDDYVEEGTFEMDSALLQRITRSPAERLFVASGAGDSMFPTLLDNDLVVIDTAQRMLNMQDRVWALSLFGAGAIKRLRTIGPDRVMVISDNKDVENQEVAAEDIYLLGRVIWLGRRM